MNTLDLTEFGVYKEDMLVASGSLTYVLNEAKELASRNKGILLHIHEIKYELDENEVWHHSQCTHFLTISNENDFIYITHPGSTI